MAYESISVSEIVPAEPARVYAAWLSSEEHSAFTGDAATIEPFVGGRHSSFGGYAVGSTVELQPGARIVQTWRAQDFPPGTPDSRVEVTLEATVGGTMVTIFHTEIPSGQSDEYRDSWLKDYLEPLKKYFGLAPAKANGVSHATPAKLAGKAKIVAAAAAPKRKAKAKARTSIAKTPAKRPAPKTKVPAKRTAKPSRLARKAKAKAKAKVKVKVKVKTKSAKRPKVKKSGRTSQKK